MPKQEKNKDFESLSNAVESETDTSVAGNVFGNIKNANNIYNQQTDDGKNRFTANNKGHGFAAEQANHLYDKITGKSAKIVGDNNYKDGADRIVNGVKIQSKYCASGSKCISDCFTDNGKGVFRYYNSEGKPMQIEVPSDKYNDAIQAMENRIRNGKVNGITDPSEAKNIVRKGHFTYEQAKNIGKFGKVESVVFDAVNGTVTAAYSFGISTVLSFAVSIWNGEDVDIAFEAAVLSGLKTGGVAFVSAVMASQVTKAGLNSVLVPGSKAVVSAIGAKNAARFVNLLRSGKPIHGAAAMNNAAKLLRSNVITGAATIMALSSFDVVNIFRNRISGKQLFKNITTTTSTVAAGTAGYVGGAAAGAKIGAAIGTAIAPGVGTAIGVGLGLLGSIFAGTVASKTSNFVLGKFIEDDAVEMTKIISNELVQMADDYLLTKSEVENIVEKLKKDKLTGKMLKNMFASNDRKNFAYDLLVSIVENEVSKRKYIELPSYYEMQNAMERILIKVNEELEDE